MMMTKGFAAGGNKGSLARAAELAANDTTTFQSVSLRCRSASRRRHRRRFAFCTRVGLDALARSGGCGTGHGSWHRQLVARPDRFLAWRLCRGARPIASGRFPLATRRFDPEVLGTFRRLPALRVSSCLAATMWQLGEVERARELIDWATKRASEVGHIGAIVPMRSSGNHIWKSGAATLWQRSARPRLWSRSRGNTGWCSTSTRPNCIPVGRGVGSVIR